MVIMVTQQWHNEWMQRVDDVAEWMAAGGVVPNLSYNGSRLYCFLRFKDAASAAHFRLRWM